MAQNTNLNTSPYFDDFDSGKNYYRVLFKPGSPIQARELTTLQSILQDQVEKVGKHFFKEGSVVIPGQIAYDSDYFYVQIDPSHLGVPVSLYISNLVGNYIKGETSGVKALVQGYITDQTSINGNYTLYVKYQGSSDTDFKTNSFVDGENLILLSDVTYSLATIRANSSFATSIVSKSVGSGSAAKIQEGVYFIRGFFVTVPTQTVILDQYSNTPSYRVGLYIEESIQTASKDNSDLYDNARGFSNFAAPGADRFKISAELISKSLDDFNDENFIELLRIENGIIQKFVKDSSYNLIRDELARRTFDEAGDYYVTPFSVKIKESLNDRIGNNGVYLDTQVTKQGNNPSENLLSVQLSPGKAYVRGYEVETIDTVSVDLPKARTTEIRQNVSVPFSLGKQFELNNVYGSTSVGFGTTSIVKFYLNRTVSAGSSSGLEIGVGRIYDLKLKNVGYADSTTKYQASFYDIQTYVYLNLNTTITQSVPAFVEGINSGANGYLVQSASNTNQLILYQVSGTFIQNEGIKINGQDTSRTILSTRDYTISDIHQVVGASGVNFSADTVLSKVNLLAPAGATFNITSGTTGISTVTTSNTNFYVGLSTGDIVAYVNPGSNVPTYNRVNSIVTTSNSITLTGISSVVGVCSGGLPNNNTQTTNLVKVSAETLNQRDSFLFSQLSDLNISSTDLTSSNFIIKKSYAVTIASNGAIVAENDTNLTFEPYNDADYNLAFSNGVIEPLNSQKLTFNGSRSIVLQNISANGAATLTATLKKVNVKSKKKIFTKCSVLVVNNSTNPSSGIGTTTGNDGLSYSSFYGTRVQDKNISLNVPDVINVLGVFESSDINDPSLPKLTLINLNSNILNSIVGELIVGSNSGAVGFLVLNNGTNLVEFVYANENSFAPGERVTFKTSKIGATILSVTVGDKNIKNNFLLNTNQRPEYADYSYLVRRSDVTAPTRRLKIVYNNYNLNSNDTGDFVTVDSYDKDLYASYLPKVSTYSASDILDVRPRVVTYNPTTATASPFEFNGRSFSNTTNSSPFNFAKDKSMNLSYSYYLGRIDRLYVDKDGKFFVNSGVPSLSPKVPNDIETALDIATLYIPPYTYSSSSVRVVPSPHKRYRMKDISGLEDRLKNVEYYTSLSLLESDTKNLTIRDDVTQLDRFKCGFFVDNFKSVYNQLLSDPYYRCSVDTNSGNLRPQHYTTSLDLILGSEAVIGTSGTSIVSNPTADLRFVSQLGNPNIKKVGDIVCLNYIDSVYLRNNFATRSENVNPFAVVNWIGAIQLSPSSDTWIETRTSRRTVDEEGSYQSTIQQLGVDTNTGLSPVTWGAWETTWTGTQITSSQRVATLPTGSQFLSSNTVRGRTDRSRSHDEGWLEYVTTDTYRDSFLNFNNVTTLTTSNQSRQGIQYRVGERYDTTSLGNRVVSTDIIHTMRSRNIEFTARRMKPTTRLYSFFDNVDMSSYIVPKLLEISMVSGTFLAGETVQGTSNSASIRFRLANLTHKYGPYNSPTQTFTQNPYNVTELLPLSYSTTSTILNIDTASLALQVQGGFYGYVVTNMRLVGQTSGAVATVTNVRLITDNTGTVIGSLFIPDATLASTPIFETGSKTFVLTTSNTNSTISGTTDSSATVNFESSGTLNNTEDLTLRIRNATVERNIQTDNRTQTQQNTQLQANTSFTNRTTTQSRWVDPLAESFEVPDPNGICVTKCDVFFRTKDTAGIPVTMQIRTMQTGLPTQTIVPFGEVVLDPTQINVSEDGTVATTFTFPSPVYLSGGNSYCVVLLSASNQYQVWISRMGETDVTTLNRTESERIVVAQQPLLGSLFKSQNGATWDPSQLEDLKMTLYRAEFYNGSASVRFYNPDLDTGNGQVASLRPNPIECISKSAIIGIARSLTSAEVSTLTSGTTILQFNNSNFSSKLKSVIGAIGINSALTITSVGSGFTSASTVYSNVPLRSLTGRGSGAQVQLTVTGGVAVAATVSIGGTGYAYGDALTVDYSQTGNFGSNLILTIPNNVGVISSFNSLLVDQIQGRIVQDTTSFLFYVGSSGTTNISGATVSYVNQLSDGLHMKVKHKNHGMYAPNDYVKLSNIESDLRPVTLNSAYSSSSTSNITVSSIGILTTFENVPVSSLNPGYVIVNKEIIKYTGFDTNTNSLTGITRGFDSTIPSSYDVSQSVFKYELNGVSLRRINTTQLLSNADNVTYPNDLDYYYVKVGMSTNGIDRTTGNANGFPELAFSQTKNCGSYDGIQFTNSNITPQASQNIPFTVLRPNIQTITPQGTSISSRVRTFSGGSPDNNTLLSFIDQGFEDISLSSDNYFSSPRIICSKVNELNYLSTYPGNKSFTMEMVLSTNDTKVSPMIDLDRVNIITVGNRLNSKVSNYSTDPRVNTLRDDPSASIYISKIVKLEKSADNLKVLFDAYRHTSNDIRVMYRIFRADTDDSTQLYDLFPGYDNLDNNGLPISFANNSGRPDRIVNASSTLDTFNSYEFTAKNIPLFTGFQIKIIMTGTNLAYAPRIRDLRVIASI